MTDAARIIARIALLVFLVSSMLSAGLTLTPRAILAPLRNVRLVLTALALNFLVAPAFAIVLTILIPLERPHAIGLLLLGGAAGAPFLPKLVENAHCDLGFAVALMTLLTVGTTLFLPFALPHEHERSCDLLSGDRAERVFHKILCSPIDRFGCAKVAKGLVSESC